MIETILLFIASLLVVVVAHEMGHFIASKKIGVAVEEFGIGFPPRLFGYTWRGTLYSINALPVGAFVKSKGENDPTEEGSLAAQAPWRRLIVYAAGPVANILLAFLLFSAFFAIPRAVVASDGLLVYQVQDGSAAFEAGLRGGDVIVEAGGDRMETWNDLQTVLAGVSPQQAVELLVIRDGALMPLEVAPEYSDTLGRNVIGITLGRNVVDGTTAGSIAADSGVVAGDSLLGVNGVGMVSQSDTDTALSSVAAESTVALTMLRDNETYTIEFPAGQLSSQPLGLQLTWAPGSRVERRGIPIGTAVLGSARYIVTMPALIVASVPLMREDPSLAFVGPIGAGQLTVEAVETFGPTNLVFIAGLISIGIALFNLIPVPPLDGGGMLVALIEVVRRGKRLSERAIRLSYAAGTALLITLVILITTSDVLRLIQGRGFGL
jgi:regulator of sigma E protease